MTSMPASRSARAITFAPRSCPSRPGFAITTRIFFAIRGQYMAMKLTVVGSSPAWPNPGGAQSGYLVEGPGRLLLDCGAGVLARLRSMNSGWPLVDSIVITHWHLDHWGDLVPWVWGNMVGPGKGKERPELWLPPQGRARIRDFGSRLGWEDMFETTFNVRDYEEAVPFQTAAGLEVLRSACRTTRCARTACA